MLYNSAVGATEANQGGITGRQPWLPEFEKLRRGQRVSSDGQGIELHSSGGEGHDGDHSGQGRHTEPRRGVSKWSGDHKARRRAVTNFGMTRILGLANEPPWGELSAAFPVACRGKFFAVLGEPIPPSVRLSKVSDESSAERMQIGDLSDKQFQPNHLGLVQINSRLADMKRSVIVTAGRANEKPLQG